jgi:single-stranded-DNA-specific exonuclease
METHTTTATLAESSLLGRRIVKREADSRLQAALTQAHEIPEIVARLLALRGISVDAAQGYLHPTMKADLPDPSHLLDMDKGAERLAAAIIAGETVAIFGDYDVDGATSSAVIARFLKALGTPCITYIPDRQKEGYGPNTAAFMALKNRGASLIITVDCGTLAFEPLAEAFKVGLDVIVVDHHLGETRRPECIALINPNRFDETTTHRYFAAVGVAYLLCVATNRILRNDGFYATRTAPDLMSLLDIVALGTVCDMVPLTGANRAFVTQGLKIMARQGNEGLKALMESAKLDRAPETFHLGYILGPRINAGGRVGESSMGVRLLTTDDPLEAKDLAERLNQFNKERQAIEELMMEEALQEAERQANRSMVMLSSDHWHMGVVGIIAGRIKERLNKPCAVVTFMGDEGKASARSVTGFDLGAAVIRAVDAGLLLRGGGHAMAAGFTVHRSKFEAVHDFFEDALSRAGVDSMPTLTVDGTVSAKGATLELAKAIATLGPFGVGNTEPLLAFERMALTYINQLNGGHIALGFTEDLSGAKLKAIAFRVADTPLGQALTKGYGKRFTLVGTLTINHYRDREEPQLKLLDAVGVDG